MSAVPTLADAGFAAIAHDPVPLEQSRRLAACLDVDPAILDHGLLPALWHWALFHPEVPTEALVSLPGPLAMLETVTVPVEQFTEEERERLAPHFTNLDRPVFGLVNLPETVKGALFDFAPAIGNLFFGHLME